MGVAIDRIILSSNDDPRYIDFWPIVARAYTKMFNIPVMLAYVSNNDESSDTYKELAKHGEVVVLKPAPNIPLPNQSKMARHFLASQQGNAVCYIDDIDLFPLSRDFIVNKVADRPKGHMLCVGAEHRAYGKSGVFPISQMTAEGYIFQQLYNPDRGRFDRFIEGLVNIHRKYPNVKQLRPLKEDITNPNPPEEYAGLAFSDEWFTRFLRDARPVPVVHKERGYDVTGEHVDSLDRQTWKFDQSKLDNHQYLMAHCVRPLYRDLEGNTYTNHLLMQPLIDYIERTY